MLAKGCTDNIGRRVSKNHVTCLEFYHCTATDVQLYTTALLPAYPLPIKHYLPVTPCHYQALSPTAGGHQHSKSLLEPAAVISFHSISRPCCCHYHCIPAGKATSSSDYCFVTGDHHVSKLIFTEILV